MPLRTLTPQQQSALTITIAPGSLRDQNGNLVTNGQVGVSIVAPTLVREMLPEGLLEHTFDITVQAPGMTNFTTPAPMTFPNLFGAKPGEKLNFLSFDHTTGKLVIEGTATVSADGLTVSTDPGVGITHPGWHGLAPQGTPTSPNNNNSKPEGDALSFSLTESLVPGQPQQQQQQLKPALQPQVVNNLSSQVGFSDWLITNDQQRVHFTAKNTTDPNAANGSDLMVTITVDPQIAKTYLDGLTTQTFVLRPGETKLFDFTVKAPDVKTLTNDLLIGAKYTVDVFQLSPGDVTTKLNGFGDYYVYRYVDAMDANASDGVLDFADTLGDGPGNASHSRFVDYKGDPSAQPTISFVSGNSFSANVIGSKRYQLLYDPPSQFNQQSQSSIRIQTPGQTPRTVVPQSDFFAEGTAVQPVTIFLNKDQFVQAFTNLASASSPVEYILDLNYNAIELASSTAPTFQIQFQKSDQTQNITLPIPFNSPALVVQKELEQRSLAFLGGKSLTVSYTHTVVNSSAGGLPTYHDTYRIQVNNIAPGTAAPNVSVAENVSGNSAPIATARRETPGGSVTIDQIIALQQPGAIDALYANMKLHLTTLYGPYSGIVFKDGSSPEPDLNLTWTLSPPRLREDVGQIAQFPAPGVEDLQKILAESSKKNSTDLNTSQFAFMEAQILSKDDHTPQTTEAGQVFVPRLFGPTTAAKTNLSMTDLATLIGSIAAHEIGHRLGLPHTSSKPVPKSQTVETQLFSITSGATSFSLIYAGASTPSIPANASASDIQAALGALPGLIDSQVQVTGPTNGVYRISFPQGLYAGIDIPTITGINITAVSGGTDGNLTFDPPQKQIISNGASGFNDIMRPTTSLDLNIFQPTISGVTLDLALGQTWGSFEANEVVALLLGYAEVGGISQPASPSTSVSPQPNSPDQIVSDLSDFDYSGPGLMLTDSDGNLADQQPLDFGTVDPNAHQPQRH